MINAQDHVLSVMCKMIGLHLEGPFITKMKKGCHNEENLRNTVSKDELSKCYGESLEGVKIITLAPELDGALDTIEWLNKDHKDIEISIGEYVD